MSEKPSFRITPIVPRPVRTVEEYRKREREAKKQARNAELEAGIKAQKEKTS